MKKLYHSETDLRLGKGQIMRSRVLGFVILLFSLLLIFGCKDDTSDPSPITERQEEEFGYGSIMQDGVPAVGRRPLLVILGSDSRFPAPIAHDAAYFNSLFFGPGDKTLVDYFSEISAETFTWSRAGVIGPINHTLPADIVADLEYEDDNQDTQNTIRARGDRKYVSWIIQAAIDAGFDFTPYDTNGDGVIWQSELAIAWLVNNGSNGGSLRGGLSPCPAQPREGAPDLEICTGVMLLGEYVGIATVAHELGHSVGRGMDDLYGSASLSTRYTLMGATIFSGNDNREVVHMDPHYKMRLGWVKPRISTLVQPNIGFEGKFGSCSQIASAQSYQGGAGSLNPIILYDLLRGPLEYLILDYRNPAMGGYDANVPSRGLGIWYVKTDENHILQRIVPGIGGCCDDVTNFLLFPPDGIRGNGNLWNNSNGLFTFNWVDGSPTNVYFGVSPQPLDNSIFEVEWATGGPLLPRVSEGLPDVTASYGQLVSISGIFGVEGFGTRIVGLTTGGSDHYLMDVESWRCGEIAARVPVGIPAGVYEMRVYSDSTRAKWENFLRVTINNEAPTVEIISPSNGASFSEGVGISLEGNSNDPGVGSLRDDQVTWYLDGLSFRDGHSSTIPAGRLSPGSHQVRFDGTDGASTVSATVNITITGIIPDVNNPPVAQITSHGNPDSEDADSSDSGGWYKTVTFTGTGKDPEDGTLSGANLQWTIRDAGGVVATGTGNSYIVKLYATGCGTTYSVELTVTDSDGVSDTYTITFTVSLLC